MDGMTSFDVKQNFWKVNPSFLVAEVFKALYTKDKSKNKEQSSTIMWGIALYYHPESTFKNVAAKDREMLIIKGHIKDPKFKFSNYKEEVKLFESMVTTAAQRALMQWDTMMDERREFLSTQKYALANCDALDKMHKGTKDLYKSLEEIKKQIEKEGDGGAIKGGGEESASEKGAI